MPRRLQFQHRKKRARELRLAKKGSPCEPQSETLSSTTTSEHAESESALPELNTSSSSTSYESQELQVTGPETVPEETSSSTNKVPVSALHSLHSTISLPSRAWSDQSPDRLNQICLCKISQFSNGGKLPLFLTHSLTVKADLSWSLYVNGQEVLPSNCTALVSFPSVLDHTSLSKLLTMLDKLQVCPGHPDTHFVRMLRAKKGKVISPDGKVVCFVHSTPVEFNGEVYQETLRLTECELLSSFTKCSVCKSYRGTLRSMYHRWSNKLQVSSDSSSYTNERYLNTPEKKMKMCRLKKKARTAVQVISKLREKVSYLTRNHGEVLDKNMETDLLAIMRENAEKVKSTYAEGTFARLFWDEQFKAASLNDKRQIRWHPVIIKWCLNLKLLSSSAYHAMRSSGFMTLPSERTLRDYTS